MPIYEYRCAQCGGVSEFLILGKHAQLNCLNCGSEELIKLVSTHTTVRSPSRDSGVPGSGACCGSAGSCGTPGGCCSR